MHLLIQSNIHTHTQQPCSYIQQQGSSTKDTRAVQKHAKYFKEKRKP